MDTKFINDNGVAIPLSKLKLFFLLLIGIAFVACGIFFILHPSAFQDKGYRNRPLWEILVLGYICIIFFGAGTIAVIMQLFNNNPGLVVDSEGITINPGLFLTTFIKWDIIKKFGVVSISRSKLIVIFLKNPEKYISQQDNPVKRKLASFNLKSYGAPLSISANSLKCNTNELLTFLNEKLKHSEIK